MVTPFVMWVVFFLAVFLMLGIDLGVFNRKAHEVRVREALGWTLVWISVALIFGAGIWAWEGSGKAFAYLTGYLIEKSLSVDNIFVFMLIFSFFGIAAKYQHRVLFYGIIGALIMRGIFISAGVALVHAFEWIFYVFGAFLIYTAVKLAMGKNAKVDPSRNMMLRLFRKFAPLTEDSPEGKFIIRRNGRMMFTPLFVVLLVVETTDVIFALDSIPAILAISVDPFIVYTSNVFAILGLRALYFAVAGMMRLFHHLHYGLSFILGFVGVKMIIKKIYEIPIPAALGVIAATLVVSIIASVLFPESKSGPAAPSNPSPA